MMVPEQSIYKEEIIHVCMHIKIYIGNNFKRVSDLAESLGLKFKPIFFFSMFSPFRYAEISCSCKYKSNLT